MRQEGEKPLIIGFAADLLFSARIESTANRLNYDVQWIEQAGQIAPPDPDVIWRQPAEHLTGPGAALLDLLTLRQPALLIFDLNNAAIPWRRWIALIKSVPATRRIPVICFGSHMDVETMQAARGAGADQVVARSRFTSNLPELIEKYARVPDYRGLDTACQEGLSALAVKGLEEFNQGRYFEAHEYLEEAWNEEESPGRELYRAILQVAVAYYHIEKGNYRGALKMFLRVRQWIDPLPDACRGVDVERLRQDARRVHAALKDLTPEEMAGFDRSLLRPVRFAEVRK